MAELDTVVLTLDVGELGLEIEQVEQLTQLAQASVRAGTDPYWAYLWPSARALVGVVATSDFDGRSVLEIGAGLGAPGLAAAARGGSVTLTDDREESLELIRKNAARNDLTVTARRMNWDDPPEDLGTFDRILASDVLYDDGMLRGVLRFAKRALADGGELWLSDPQRIPDSGIRGAALLSGFETEHHPLVPGRTLTGGVTLHVLRRRPRRR